MKANSFLSGNKPIVLMALLACLGSSTGPTWAQAATNPFTNHKLHGPPPALPYLPNFGGKFLMGHQFPNANDVQCWVLRYGFQGKATDVLNSIEQSLPSQGWSIDKRQAKPQQFTAERRQDNLMLSVKTQAGRNPGRTVATVRYVQYKQSGQ